MYLHKLTLVLLLPVTSMTIHPASYLNKPPTSQYKSISINRKGNSPHHGQLFFTCNGIVGHIYVHKGQTYKKGTLLASLRYEDVNMTVMQAVFYMDNARANYNSVKDQYENKKTGHAQLNMANKAFKDAQGFYERSISTEQNYYLTANAGGRVIRQQVREGELVEAGEIVLVVK